MDIKKQITINALGSFWSMFAQWIISIVLVRLGGFAEAGVFSLAMSMANVFGAVANYSIRSYQVSDAGEQFTQGQYLWTRAATITASIVLCGVYFLIDTGYTSSTRWCIFLYLLYVDLGFFSDILFGSLQLKDMLYVNGYSNFLKGFCTIAVFFTGYLVTGSLAASLLCMVIVNAVCTCVYDLRLYLRMERGAFRFGAAERAAVKKLLILCFPLMMSLVLPLITTAVPRRAIGAIWGDEMLGYFSSLFTPTVVITTLMPTIILGFIPGIAGAWQEKKKGMFLRLTVGCCGGVVGFTLLAMLCALVAGRPVMQLLFGSEILPYFPLLYAAIIASGLCALRGCCSNILVCIRRTKTVMAASVVETVAALGLSNLLIEQRQIEGAAVTLMIAYGASLLIQVICIVIPCKEHFKEKGIAGD